VPAAKRLQEGILHVRLEPLLTEAARRDDGLPNLVEIGDAVWALLEVGLEAKPVAVVESTFEVVGDELDEVRTAEVTGIPHQKV
jgi:hypothetical protein